MGETLAAEVDRQLARLNRPSGGMVGASPSFGSIQVCLYFPVNIANSYQVGPKGDVYPTGANVRASTNHRAIPAPRSDQNPSTLAEGNDTPGRSGETGQPKNRAAACSQAKAHAEDNLEAAFAGAKSTKKTKRRKDEPSHEKRLPGQTQFGSGPPYVACGYQYRQCTKICSHWLGSAGSQEKVTRRAITSKHSRSPGVLVRRKHTLHVARQRASKRGSPPTPPKHIRTGPGRTTRSK